MPYTIRTTHRNQTFLAEEGETILDAALRQNFDIPHSCCEGICGSCEGQVIDGIVTYENTEHLVLDAQDRAQGRALFCCAKACSDLLIDVPGMSVPHHTFKPTHLYTVESLTPLSQDIYQAILLPKNKPLHYLAGQYIEIHLPNEEPKPFSIANAPNTSHALELHIRCQAENMYAQHLIRFLQTEKTLSLKGGFGSCYFHAKPSMPMILLAVGTGFAPMKAILEEAFKTPLQHEITLFWAGKSLEDFYQLKEIKQWEASTTNFHCVPVLSNDNGNIFDAVLDYAPNLAHHHLYFGGPMQLTLDGLERFVEHGAQTCTMYSDAFDFL